jgi:hypothetical protein
MTTTQAQQLQRCDQALQSAQDCLVLDGYHRRAALLDAREEIDATLAVLRRESRLRAHPAALALLTVCIGLFGFVSVKAVVLLTEGRPAVEVRE